jgi:nitrate/nitrite-specific signal transduction histidine kinase
MTALSLVRPPPPLGPVDHRLRWLTEATVALLSEEAQTIQTEVRVAGGCPEPLVPVVLQVALEMVDNAVRHGMRLRLIGRVDVSLWVFPGYHVNLMVLDDGWGPGAAQPGDGLSIMASLAGQFDGTVSLRRKGSWTVATMTMPDRLHMKA